MRYKALLVTLAAVFLAFRILNADIINLNTVRFDELLKIKKVSEEEAKRIIEYAEQKGFKSIEELQYIVSPEAAKNINKVNLLYAVPENIWAMRFTDNIDHLRPERLEIKTFNFDGNPYLITFPDGGTMLINCGFISNISKLTSLLDKALASNKSSRAMSLIGKLPRIDWLIITSIKENDPEAVGEILINFNVRQIITSFGPKDINNSQAIRRTITNNIADDSVYSNITEDIKIDVLQTVSPVNVMTYGASYSGNASGVAIKIDYSNISALILPESSDEFQENLIKDFRNKLNCDYLLGDISGIIRQQLSSAKTLEMKGNSIFATDGYLSYIKDGGNYLPKSADKNNENNFMNVMAREAIEKRYNYAVELMSNNQFLEAKTECENILLIEPGHKPSILLIEEADRNISKIIKRGTD